VRFAIGVLLPILPRSIGRVLHRAGIGHAGLPVVRAVLGPEPLAPAQGEEGGVLVVAFVWVEDVLRVVRERVPLVESSHVGPVPQAPLDPALGVPHAAPLPREEHRPFDPLRGLQHDRVAPKHVFAQRAWQQPPDG